MNKDLYDLTAELDAVENIIIGLANQLDSSRYDSLRSDTLRSALFGVSEYLNRISEDLMKIDENRTR